MGSHLLSKSPCLQLFANVEDHISMIVLIIDQLAPIQDQNILDKSKLFIGYF